MAYTDSRRIVVEVVGHPDVKIVGIEAPSKVEVNKATYLKVIARVVSTGVSSTIKARLALENVRGNPGDIVVYYQGRPWTVRPNQVFIVNIGPRPTGAVFTFDFRPIFKNTGRYTLKIYAGYK